MPFIDVSSLNGLRLISEGLSGKGQVGRQTQRLINLTMAEFQSGGSGAMLNVSDIDHSSFRDELRYGKGDVPPETMKLFNIMLDYINNYTVEDDSGANLGVQSGNQTFESYKDVENFVMEEWQKSTIKRVSDSVTGKATSTELQIEKIPPGSEKVFITFVNNLMGGIEEVARGEGEMSEYLDDDPDEWHRDVAMVNRQKASVINFLRGAKGMYNRGITARPQMQRVLGWFDQYMPDFRRRGGFEDYWFDLNSVNRSDISLTDLYHLVF